MEIDPRTGLWKHPQPYKKPVNQTDEMIEDFIAKCEREAAKLEITVDYYIKEFILSTTPEITSVPVTTRGIIYFSKVY